MRWDQERYAQKLFSLKSKMAAESAASETNDTNKFGYKMKITLMKRF